jgi:hypothetical protein
MIRKLFGRQIFRKRDGGGDHHMGIQSSASRPSHYSPLTEALQKWEQATSKTLLVYFDRSYRYSDSDHFGEKLYQNLRTTTFADSKSLVLIYVHLRAKNTEIIAGALETTLPTKLWTELKRLLEQDLKTTHTENAVALFVATLLNFLSQKNKHSERHSLL